MKTINLNNIYINNKQYIIIIRNIIGDIQKRKYLNNIYIKLPNDLQNHILYFIKHDFYSEKLNNKLNLIVSNKINNYINDFNNKFDIPVPFNMLLFIYNNQKYILNSYRLF